MNNRTVLISFAVALLVLYVLMFVMLIVVMNRTSAQAGSANGQTLKPETKETLPTLSTSSLTDFFNRSLQHAQKVLYGSEPFVPVAGNSQSWLIALALKMNEDTKAQVGRALQYGLIQPTVAQADETRLRGLAIQQNVPLWFSILADAVNKVVPMQLAGTLSLPTPSAQAGANSNKPETIETLQTPVSTPKKRKKSCKTGPKVIRLNATG